PVTPLRGPTDREEPPARPRDAPNRWPSAACGHAKHAGGWARAGPPNGPLRAAQRPTACMGPTGKPQLRAHRGARRAGGDASPLAPSCCQGLAGAMRVTDDPRIVTSDDAPNVEPRRDPAENRPDKWRAQHLQPHMPWLDDVTLDCRFRSSLGFLLHLSSRSHKRP